jgi:hypothetical protein
VGPDALFSEVLRVRVGTPSHDSDPGL